MSYLPGVQQENRIHYAPRLTSIAPVQAPYRRLHRLRTDSTSNCPEMSMLLPQRYVPCEVQL